MPTMNTVIEELGGLKPNVVPDETKMKWIANLDGLISVQVHMDAEPIQYKLPNDADKALLVGAPFDDIYVLYCSAMVDFYNREYNNYNFSVSVFNDRLEAYRAYHIQRHPTCMIGNFRNV